MNEQFRRWGETKAPCNGCTLRYTLIEDGVVKNCHSDCPKDKMEEYNFIGYAAFKSTNDQQKQRRTEFLKQNDVLTEIHAKRGRRVRSNKYDS